MFGMSWVAAACVAALVSGASGSARPISLRPGAIGVVRVDASDPNTYSVTILFPMEEVDGFTREDLSGRWTHDLEIPLESPGILTLFDEAGRLGTVAVGQLHIVFWCENDGGVHFRPEWAGKIRRTSLARALGPVSALQGIAAFALVAGGPKAHNAHRLERGGEVALTGALDHGGKIEAQIVTAPEEAGCDGDPPNGLAITLRTAHGTSGLRCCGP
jgi:hypothetical protein